MKVKAAAAAEVRDAHATLQAHMNDAAAALSESEEAFAAERARAEAAHARAVAQRSNVAAALSQRGAPQPLGPTFRRAVAAMSMAPLGPHPGRTRRTAAQAKWAARAPNVVHDAFANALRR